MYTDGYGLHVKVVSFITTSRLKTEGIFTNSAIWCKKDVQELKMTYSLMYKVVVGEIRWMRHLAMTMLGSYSKQTFYTHFKISLKPL